MGDITIKNRNLPDLDLQQRTRGENYSHPILTKEMISERIKENLNIWENMIEKHHGIKYNSKIAQKIKKGETQRLIIKSMDSYKNERLAYTLGKHFVNAGIRPNEVCIISIEDCYLHIRAIGPESREIKEQIFSPKNKVLIITELQNNKETYIQDNVKSFWEEFLFLAEKNKGLHIILAFNEYNKNKWIYNSKDFIERFNQLKFKAL